MWSSDAKYIGAPGIHENSASRFTMTGYWKSWTCLSKKTVSKGLWRSCFEAHWLFHLGRRYFRRPTSENIIKHQGGEHPFDSYLIEIKMLFWLKGSWKLLFSPNLHEILKLDNGMILNYFVINDQEVVSFFWPNIQFLYRWYMSASAQKPCQRRTKIRLAEDLLENEDGFVNKTSIMVAHYTPNI